MKNNTLLYLKLEFGAALSFKSLLRLLFVPSELIC